MTQLLAEAEVEVAKGLQVDKDKAPRLSIRIVIWISPSDTDTVFVNTTKISTNIETAILLAGLRRLSETFASRSLEGQAGPQPNR